MTSALVITGLRLLHNMATKHQPENEMNYCIYLAPRPIHCSAYSVLTPASHESAVYTTLLYSVYNNLLYLQFTPPSCCPVYTTLLFSSLHHPPVSSVYTTLLYPQFTPPSCSQVYTTLLYSRLHHPHVSSVYTILLYPQFTPPSCILRLHHPHVL